MIQQVFNNNELTELRGYLSKFSLRKIFFIVDKSSYKLSGAESFLNNIFKTEVTVTFSDFNPNPQIKDLKKGIEIFNKDNYELIVAIGGGSAIDMAKLISVFANQSNEIEEVLKGKELDEVKTPLLAIPTTSGTGAEATAFSVLYVDKVKFSVASDYILPDMVYLSPEFTYSAGAYLTACTGLDAFCQAVESVWSVNSTQESEEYAYKAVDIVWNNLKNAVVNNDKEAKALMQEAAFLAGKAINITKTTAPHALSYAFTSYYNIPHGHAVSLSLAYFFEFNIAITENDCIDSRGSKAVKNRINKLINILNIDAENLSKELNLFFESVGINTNILTLIESFNPEIITANINIERLNNNPRLIDNQVIVDFLKLS